MAFQRATISSLAADLEPVTEEDLVDILWQWVSLVETMPASQSMVADSENYNLVFRADGTYSAKADCNQLMGSYELLGSQLKLQPGISTLAECGPDSSYDLYMSLLERVEGAGAREGVLVLLLAEDASPQRVLDQLRGQGLEIQRFEITTPSLHSIFLLMVGGDHG
jgi:heat shock protein HslJ